MNEKQHDSFTNPPPNIRLTNSDVHIWRVDLAIPDAYLETGQTVLSSLEKQRAERFLVSSKRKRYLASHIALHVILSKYTCTSPSEILFETNPHGKPFLSSASFQFNLSHSRNQALVGVCHHEIGIDIEWGNRNIPFQDIANRFFSEQEIAVLKATPEEEKKKKFFDYWTCKEAFVKSQGVGLSMPLDAFTVSFQEYGNHQIAEVEGKISRLDQRLIQLLNIGDGYSAAFAIRKMPFHLSLFDFLWDT